MRLKETALTIVVAALLVLSMGCIGGDDGPDLKIELTLMGMDAQNVVVGNNTTVLFEVENNWKDDADLYMTIDKVPDKWSIEFLPENVTLPKHNGTGIRMNVSVPLDAVKTRHDLKVWLRAEGNSEQKRELVVTIFPQDQALAQDVQVAKPGGATVYVNYTGYLANGEVFDTTNEDISLSNNIPKWDGYQGRGNYDPQPFDLGKGQLIAGFERALTGMRKGEFKSFFVPDTEAYSHYTEFQFNLTDTIPLQEEWEWSEFERAFRQEPAMWLEVKHRKWNWTAQVVNLPVEEGGHRHVVLQLKVRVGDNTTTYGWESVVQSIDSTANGGMGEIVLVHHPGPVGAPAQIYNSSAPKEYDFGEVIELTDDWVRVRVQQSHHDLAGRDLIFACQIHDFQ